MLTMCAKLGNSQLLVQTFGRLGEDGLVPTLDIFNCMINGFCKQGNITCAMVFFDSMKSRKIQPCIVTYSTLMDGLAVAGDVDTLHAVYTELLKSGIGANDNVYEMMMRGYAIKGMDKEVMLFRSKMSVPDSLASIRALVVLACNQQNMAKMESLYEQAKLIVKKDPTNSYHLKLINDIFVHRIRAYARDPRTPLKFFDELLQQLQSLLPRASSPRIFVYDELIRTYILRQALGPVEDCLQQLNRKWPNKVHELLRDSTVELLRSATRHLDSLPPMVEAIRDSPPKF